MKRTENMNISGITKNSKYTNDNNNRDISQAKSIANVKPTSIYKENSEYNIKPKRQCS